MKGGVKTAKFASFKGLNNKDDPMSLGNSWLTRAENVDITSTGVSTRPGFLQKLAGDFQSGIASRDFDKIFVASTTQILMLNEDLTTRPLCDLTVPDPVRFLEINKEFYWTNGTDSGLIKQDNRVYDWNWRLPEMPDAENLAGSGVLDEGMYQVVVTHILADGRETGASPAFVGFCDQGDSLQITRLTPMDPSVDEVLVYIKPPKSTVFQLLGKATGDAMIWSGDPNELADDLLDPFISPLPGAFTDFVLWQGQIAWMQYNQAYDTTYVWFSEPLIFHQFRQDNYLAIKGRGAALLSHPDGLVIGMENELLTFDGEKIEPIAKFGAVPGYGVIADSDGTMLMWTQRGWCSFFPFVKLMENQVSVSPGDCVGSALIESKGAKKVVAVVQTSGDPFNARSSPEGF